MMRELVADYLSSTISRRNFINGLIATGVSVTSARSAAESLTPFVSTGTAAAALPPQSFTMFEGTAGAALAEQLIASGVKYVFGNCATGDAPFYEALVDRPQLHYILTPHEGPGSAMAAGYSQASHEPSLVMQAAIVGISNAIGAMYAAWKEQTPVVFYSYRADRSTVSGSDVFEEVAYQEEMVGPITKWYWHARRPEAVPETIRRAFKVAWTPPYGPAYTTWHADYNFKQVRTPIISHDKVDPRLRIRPNPGEVERAAELLIKAERPLLVVGDELYKTNSVARAVKFAELLGLPVAVPPLPSQVFANFPQTHPLWVGERGIRTYKPDLVINIGNKMQRFNKPLLPPGTRFIDMRIDAASVGNAIPVDVPLVADVAYGIDDLSLALGGIMTSTFKKRVQARTEEVRAFTQRANRLRKLMVKNPQWNDTPMLSERVNYEIARFADRDAVIVDETESVGGKELYAYDVLGGREYFGWYSGYLGSLTGRAAGVKLARPGRQVIALVGDGAFIFGPTGLWNMARLELPVIVVVFNNHAYGGPHNRIISRIPDGRMVETRRFVFDYLGSPDMNMAHIAKGFGVDGEVANSPGELRAALQRARRANREGKPYLIDAQVARTGVAWAERPWTPSIQQA